MSSHYPFCAKAVLAGRLAAMALLTPAAARAQTAQQAAVNAGAKAEAPKPEAGKSDAARPAEAPTTGTAGNAAVQANPAQKSIAARAVDKVKEAAKSASDMFSRVPCLPPKGGYQKMGSLPHVANKLIAGQPVADHRLRLILDPGLWFERAGIHLSQSARRATQASLSDRRHHRAQPRQGRRGRRRNDAAAADRGDRHEARSRDLAGRHQRGAAQSRSGRDREARRGRRRAHSGRGQRHRAGRSRNIRRASTRRPKTPAR